MFFYLYDIIAGEKKFEDVLIKAENRLIELGINGRIEKLTILRNPKELIEEAIKHDAHTVVAVGDDNTLLKVINLTADHNVVIGYIPLIPDSPLAKIFGISSILDACNILSKRLIKKISLGKANHNYFLASLNIPNSEEAVIECDDKYKIRTREKNCQLAIYNLGNFLEKKDEKEWIFFANKTSLNLLVCPQQQKGFSKFFQKKNANNNSIFQIKKIKITTEQTSQPVFLDGQTVIKTPVNVTLKNKKISLIVSKSRLF